MNLARHPLSGADYRVALVVARHLNSHSGQAWPSLQTIADLTGLDPSTVWKSVERLRRAGFLEVTKGGGRKRYNVYRPRMGDAEAIADVLPSRKKTYAKRQAKYCEMEEQTLEGSVEEHQNESPSGEL